MSLLEPNSARDCERPPGYLIDDLGYLTDPGRSRARHHRQNAE